MNHTIKGILIAAAITSMLVVGTSMIPIMQNSFAHKRSDFKGAESDPNTNTNTNTNSATSSSDSNATAENTNNIDNTATATQNQEQDACAVAVTCPGGSTTVTPPPVPVGDGCPSGTLYDVTTRTDLDEQIKAGTELCLPKMLGDQTATIAGTSTTIEVVIANPDVANCPPNTVKADVTSGPENVRFSTVCVHTPGP